MKQICCTVGSLNLFITDSAVSRLFEGFVPNCCEVGGEVEEIRGGHERNSAKTEKQRKNPGAS